MADQSDRSSRSSELNKKSESVPINLSFFVRDYDLHLPFFRIEISHHLTDLRLSSQNSLSDGRAAGPKKRISSDSFQDNKCEFQH